jgi:hypothetical protein
MYSSSCNAAMAAKCEHTIILAMEHDVEFSTFPNEEGCIVFLKSTPQDFEDIRRGPEL